MTLFDAWDLATGWLSVAVASSKDEARPALHRTVAIEAFHEGVRLTATDSYLLLTAWVPNLDHPDEPPPPLDVAPYGTTVAIDPHGRARGLLGHALGLAHAAEKADDPEPVEVSLQLGVVDEVDDRSMLAGMEVPWVVIELPGTERVKLRTYEGEYPNWRGLFGSVKPKRTAGVGLSADRLAQLAKLTKYHPAKVLRMAFAGDGHAVHLEVEDRHIEGLAMTVRTDMETGDPIGGDE